jgi:hypothetical protein
MLTNTGMFAGIHRRIGRQPKPQEEGKPFATDEGNSQRTTFQTARLDTDNPSLSPLELDTLQLTSYVLKLIKNGITTSELCACLEGEYSLAGAYLRLFSEWEWISKQGNKWLLTALGEENIYRFQSPR